MTMKKRITSFALVLLMVLSSLAVLLPVTGVRTAAEETTATTKTYTKVTEKPTDWSGTYLIVYEKSDTEGYVFNGSLEKLDVASNYESFTITDSSISASDEYAFTVAKSGDDYSIRSSSGKYIGNDTKNKNTLTFGTTALNNTIAWDETNLCIDIKTSVDAHLRFNTSSGDTRFRYYKSTSYTNQKPIQLYKLDTGSTPTEPDVPVHEGEHTYGDWTYKDTDTHSRQCTIEGCKETETANHEITWTSLDENKHTGKCKDCGYTTEGAHDWVTDTGATDVPDGKLAQKCSVCGETRTVDKPNTVTETIDFTKCNFENGKAVPDEKYGNFALTFDTGSNSNAPKYYTTGTAVRMYGGNKLTIKGDNGEKIAKIKFTFASGEGDNAIIANSGAFETDTWTGSANEVTFTIDGTSGHRRIKSLEITYEVTATKPDTSKMIDSATLNLGTNIDVNYYVTIPDGMSYDSYVMRFTFNGKTYDVTGAESNGQIKFTFKDVGPHQMGLNISAALYGMTGDTETKLSEKATYSVKENLESLLTSESETVKTLAKNMLIYGAAAQKYTGADDADLVTSETHTETPNLADTNAASVDNKNESVNFVGMILYFDSEPRLAIKYELLNGATADDVTFEDLNGKLTHDGEYVYLDGVTADKFAEENMIANDLDNSTVSFTVNTYIYYVLRSETTSKNMKTLATALYYYGVAAAAYVSAQ